MKHLFCFIAFASILNAFGQDDLYPPQHFSENMRPPVSKENQKCPEWIFNEDDFTGKKMLTMPGFQTIYYPRLSNMLSYLLYYTDKFYILSLSISSKSNVCLNSDSKMLIKFDNDSITEPEYSGKIECGNSLFPKFVLDNNSLEQLANAKIAKIRIYFSEGYLDYELPPYIKRSFTGDNRINPASHIANSINCLIDEVEAAGFDD